MQEKIEELQGQLYGLIDTLEDSREELEKGNEQEALDLLYVVTDIMRDVTRELSREIQPRVVN